MLQVEQRHPDGERQHRGRLVRDVDAVVERPVHLAWLVCGRAVHDQLMRARADPVQQEAARVIRRRGPGADP